MVRDVLGRLVDHASVAHDGLQRDARGRALLAVAAGWLLTLGARYLLPALLPAVTDTFPVTDTTAGVAITVVWATYALVQLPAGVLTDRFGECHLLACSLALGSVALAALSAAPAFAVFLGACALFGVATGLYGPARGTVVSRTFAERDSAALGVTLAAGSLGSAAIPALGGGLASRYGWRLALGVGAPTFLAAAALAWRHVPDTTTSHDASARHTAHQVVAALHDPGVYRAFAAVATLLFVFQGLTAFLTTYLVRTEGLRTGTAAGLFALVFVAGAGFQLLAGHAADRYGTRPVLVGLTAVGALALAALPAVHGALPLAVVLALLGARLGTAPVTNAYVLDRLPDDAQGAAWGVLRTSYFLLAATGSTFVGWLADHTSLRVAFYALAGLAALATALYARLPRRAPRRDW